MQWNATTALFEMLIAQYALSDRQSVKGHLEWSPSQCPGPVFMSRLHTWRANPSSQEYRGGVFQIRDDVGSANVREGPSREYPIALGDKAVMWPGDLLEADVIVVGEQIGDEARWVHRADGLGFVHLSLLTRMLHL